MRTLLMAGALLFAGRAGASDQTGVYAYVSSVVFEPNASDVSTATKAKITGWFRIANGALGQGDKYTDSAMGYLYYSCPTGKESVCRSEWTDIKYAAGSKDCKTWGSRTFYTTTGNGTVRTDANASSPDPYPVNQGVATANPNFNYCPVIPDGGVEPKVDMAQAGAVDMAKAAPVDMAQTPVNTPKSGCSAALGTTHTGMGAMVVLGLLAVVTQHRRRRS